VTWLSDTILRLAAPLVLLVVFALPALEASTLLGIVVPGELALVLGGVLAHQGRVPLWATALLRRLGGRAVFVGRFTAALRALVPGLAGTARMPYRTFLAWNLAGGVLWATTFVLLGFAAGPAAPEGPGHR
jgi:membrane-associated protein